MYKCLTLLGFMLVSNAASAGDLLSYLTDENGKYIGPTVEENVALMDTDKNGFADVQEVRAFLALKHGKDYEKNLLDRWELHAQGNSCHSPSVNELYSEKK